MFKINVCAVSCNVMLSIACFVSAFIGALAECVNFNVINMDIVYVDQWLRAAPCVGKIGSTMNLFTRYF